MKGFRVFSETTEIRLGRLTVLAGANSSGKSSALQPLLLMKQTLDAPFDPGGLRLDGDNVVFTASSQFLAKGPPAATQVVFGVSTHERYQLEVTFAATGANGLRVVQATSRGPRGRVAELRENGRWKDRPVRRVRFLLGINRPDLGDSIVPPTAGRVAELISDMLHLPGLRSSPLRTYPVTAVGDSFPGTFDRYVASAILQWQSDGDSRLADLSADLSQLGLTWKVEARRIDDTRVELRVGRLPKGTRGGAKDLVSIADVGVGVSQALPVLVALRTAGPGQLVFIEQPELHLHPRAQWALAEILIKAAKRGVQVVIETHSSLLLLGLQALAATMARQEPLRPSDVQLHWFSRKPDGSAEVRSAALDDAGAFGDWPADFDDVTLEAQDRYLSAIEAAGKKR